MRAPAILARPAFAMARYWPSLAGIAIRRYALPGLVAECGPTLTLGAGCILMGPERIRLGARLNAMSGLRIHAAETATVTIGDDCSLNDNVQISAGPSGSITLGDAVLIGANVVIRNSNHAWRDPDRRIRDQGHEPDDITIGDDVWIGANSVVLPGARIPGGCVIAAGSVVRRGDYEPGAVLAGNPARQVSSRFASAASR